MWVDAHCHLQLEPSRHGDPVDPDVLVASARDAGVDWMVCVSTDLATSREAVALAARHDDVYATVGLHPHEASRLDEEWRELEALAHDRGNGKIVGIGEAGFDLYYEHSPLDEQAEAFARQIALAHELDLALVIHTRDAWDATFAMLHECGVPRRTIVHCFSGGPPEAERALALGCLLSYSGIVSFKAADELRAAAAITPPDRVLVETDAPYLAPVPYRGKPNQPAYVVTVGVALAAARGEAAADTARLTAANATAAFSASARSSSRVPQLPVPRHPRLGARAHAGDTSHSRPTASHSRTFGAARP
jgi:TatD DNase family protein